LLGHGPHLCLEFDGKLFFLLTGLLQRSLCGVTFRLCPGQTLPRRLGLPIRLLPQAFRFPDPAA
jgi:hypothetical protein